MHSSYLIFGGLASKGSGTVGSLERHFGRYLE
jgi:hypothetical protein